METSADATETTSHAGDAAAAIPATTASAAAAVTPDCQSANLVATGADPTACSESLSVATSTDTTLTLTPVSSAIQSTAVVEEPAYTTDEQWQCSECKKSFRSETLREYHKKYYHRVVVTDTASVTSRRPSLPSDTVERAPSGRFRSKNKSTCKGSSLKLHASK